VGNQHSEVSLNPLTDSCWTFICSLAVRSHQCKVGTV